MADDDRILTFEELKAKKGWSFSDDHTRTLWKAGKFPKPFKVPGGNVNLWMESVIDAYLAERAKSGRG